MAQNNSWLPIVVIAGLGYLFLTRMSVQNALTNPPGAQQTVDNPEWEILNEVEYNHPSNQSPLLGLPDVATVGPPEVYGGGGGGGDGSERVYDRGADREYPHFPDAYDLSDFSPPPPVYYLQDFGPPPPLYYNNDLPRPKRSLLEYDLYLDE